MYVVIITTIPISWLYKWQSLKSFHSSTPWWHGKVSRTSLCRASGLGGEWTDTWPVSSPHSGSVMWNFYVFFIGSLTDDRVLGYLRRRDAHVTSLWWVGALDARRWISGGDVAVTPGIQLIDSSWPKGVLRNVPMLDITHDIHRIDNFL